MKLLQFLAITSFEIRCKNDINIKLIDHHGAPILSEDFVEIINQYKSSGTFLIEILISSKEAIIEKTMMSRVSTNCSDYRKNELNN